MFLDIFNEAVERFINSNGFTNNTISQLNIFRENIKRFADKLNYDFDKGVFYE